MNLVQGPRPFARTDCTGMDLGKGPLRLGRQDWRLCMVCKDYLPATDFPKGQRRYRCKKHGWLKGGKRSKLKMLADPRRFAVNRLWGITFSDRTIFRQDCNLATRNQRDDGRHTWAAAGGLEWGSTAPARLAPGSNQASGHCFTGECSTSSQGHTKAPHKSMETVWGGRVWFGFIPFLVPRKQRNGFQTDFEPGTETIPKPNPKTNTNAL